MFQFDKYVITDYGIFPKGKKEKDSTAPNNHEIALCEKWLYEFAQPQKRFNERFSSYGLKHQVEKWAGEYVSNGALIFAALSLKFPVKVIDEGPNAIFGIKLFTPEEKWKHIRPTKFSKWLFKQKDNDNVIGDLARDAIIDKNWPRTAEYYIEFWEYLLSLGVHESVIDSLCTAWEEFTGQKAPNPSEKELEKCELFYGGHVDIISDGDSYPNAPNGFTFIYVLFEEGKANKSKKVKYVGQTVAPVQRLQQHTISPGNREKVKWIGGLLNQDKEPSMAIIDYVPLNEAIYKERVYITAFIHYERQGETPYDEVLLNKSLL